jgi:hypothetical protein
MEGHPMNAQCSFLLLRGLPNVDKSASSEQEASCRITWNLTGDHWGSLERSQMLIESLTQQLLGIIK